MNKNLLAIGCLFYLCSLLSVEAISANYTNIGGETKGGDFFVRFLNKHYKNNKKKFKNLGVWNYYGYPYHYYNWYYAFPTYTFTVSTCSSVAACPVQCPGTCGLWSGLYACRFSSCAISIFI